MLFHPREPKQILGLTVQGIFPKRQKQFAEKLGKLVGDELLSFRDIEQKISNPENIQKIMPFVEKHIDEFLRVKLGQQMPMIAMFVGEKTIDEMKRIFIEELQNLFPVIMQNYMGELQKDLDLEKIVYSRVSSFSSEKLEDILNQIMSKEFKFVELLGGVLGFIIGIVQVLITLIA